MLTTSIGLQTKLDAKWYIPGAFNGNITELCLLKKTASYPERSNLGAPDYTCKHCNAIFWYQERIKSDSSCRQNRITYNSCCKGGKIKIPRPCDRPEPLASLARFNGGPTSNKFMRNIHKYNCLFAFTSMGANIDRSVNDGRDPPVFKIHGQVHHHIVSLLPCDGSPPKFLQLYIYDTSNDVQNRIRALHPTDQADESLDPSIIESLIKILDEHN